MDANNPDDAGTYIVDKKGKRTLLEPVTADHPEGNRARPADDEPAPIAPTTTTKGGEA